MYIFGRSIHRMRYESDPAQRCRDNSAGSKLGHCTRGCVPLDCSKKRPQKPQFFKIETCKTITRDFLTFDFKKD